MHESSHVVSLWFAIMYGVQELVLKYSEKKNNISFSLAL